MRGRPLHVWFPRELKRTLFLSLVVYNDASRRPDPSAFSKLDLWHSDVSYEIQPPSTTSLKVIEGPPYGGDTLWSSG